MVVHSVVSEPSTRTILRHAKFDVLRQFEYDWLDERGHTHHDYAGATLFGRTQPGRYTDDCAVTFWATRTRRVPRRSKARFESTTRDVGTTYRVSRWRS